jgi:hypothetical protein
MIYSITQILRVTDRENKEMFVVAVVQLMLLKLRKRRGVGMVG